MVGYGTQIQKIYEDNLQIFNNITSYHNTLMTIHSGPYLYDIEEQCISGKIDSFSFIVVSYCHSDNKLSELQLKSNYYIFCDSQSCHLIPN